MASHSHHTPSFLTPDDVDVKLNGSNYKEWLTTIRVILLGLEMFGHIDSTSISPLESSITSSGGSSSPLQLFLLAILGILMIIGPRHLFVSRVRLIFEWRIVILALLMRSGSICSHV